LPGLAAAIEDLAMGWQMPTSYCRVHQLTALNRMLPSLRLRQDARTMETMGVSKLKQGTLASQNPHFDWTLLLSGWASRYY
jgi:hypothetical protein